MNNQKIDGVPRELLERICALDNGGRTQVQHHYDLIELRALLDASSPPQVQYIDVDQSEFDSRSRCSGCLDIDCIGACMENL